MHHAMKINKVQIKEDAWISTRINHSDAFYTFKVKGCISKIKPTAHTSASDTFPTPHIKKMFTIYAFKMQTRGFSAGLDDNVQ